MCEMTASMIFFTENLGGGGLCAELSLFKIIFIR